jgi:hypothetical protein
MEIIMKLSAHIDSLIIKNIMKIENADYNIEFTPEEFLTLVKTYPELIAAILAAVKES